MKYSAAAMRLDAIVSVLDNSGFATIANLALTVGVSEMTIRRDLRQLRKDGRIRLVHGGAYARERTTPQRIRCAVEAVVIRPPRQIRDMRDVVSYDLIIDGIRMLVQSGHIALLETMAEQVAAMVLAHPLVVKVNVKLEKLDTGSGIVGVSIERVRAAADTARIRHPIVSGG